MSCNCTNRGSEKTDQTFPPFMNLTLSMDPEKDHPLACPRCLEKHVSAAIVYANEVFEDPTRQAERMMLIGNLVAAEDHARALNLVDLAMRIRGIRSAFQVHDIPNPVIALREILPLLPKV